MVTKPASEIFRDYVVDGNPASGAHSPIKADIRQWGGEVESFLTVPLAIPMLVGGALASSTLTLQSTTNVGAGDDRIIIRSGQSFATPSLVLTPVSGRLAAVTQVDNYGNWFITARDGSSNESSIGGDYDLEHPFVRVGQPNSASDPNKPPGTVFNISANVTASVSAFNVFDCNVYSNSTSTHGHYAGQFTAFSGAASSGVGAIGVNVFNDNAAAGSHGITVGVASSVAISGGDLGGIQIIVGQHGGTPRAVDFALHIASRGTGLSFDKAIRLDDSNVISSTGTIFGLRNGTRINCAWGIDFLPSAGVTDATFSGGAFRSTGFSVNGSGAVSAAGATVDGNLTFNAGARTIRWGSIGAAGWGTSRTNSVAANGSVTIPLTAGLVIFRDESVGGWAMYFYDGGTITAIGTPSANFVTADPGAGTSKWWINNSGGANIVATNRYAGAENISYAVIGLNGGTLV